MHLFSYYFTGDQMARGQERSALFIWKGRHSNTSGRELSPALTNQCSSQVFVTEGEEPPCFLQLFQGGMVIYRKHSRDTGLVIANSNTLPYYGSTYSIWQCRFGMCFRRLASVLCEGWCVCGGQSVGGTMLLLQSEVSWLIGLAEQPAGGDLPVAWLQSSQQSTSGGQADRPTPHTDVSHTFNIMYKVSYKHMKHDEWCTLPDCDRCDWLWWIGAHLSWVWELAALWMSRKWRRGKSPQNSGMLLDHRTGSHMTACYKVWCITNHVQSCVNFLCHAMNICNHFSQEMFYTLYSFQILVNLTLPPAFFTWVPNQELSKGWSSLAPPMLME